MRAALVALALLVVSVTSTFAGPGYYGGYGYGGPYGAAGYANYRNEAPSYYAGDVTRGYAYSPYAGYGYDDYGYSRRSYRRHRSNNLLGAAIGIGLANEAFNHGRSKRSIRGAAAGLALIGALSR